MFETRTRDQHIASDLTTMNRCYGVIQREFYINSPSVKTFITAARASLRVVSIHQEAVTLADRRPTLRTSVWERLYDLGPFLGPFRGLLGL